MSRITLNELHREILSNLTQEWLLDRLNLTEEKVHSLVLNKHFVNKLSTLVNKSEITCTNVLNLCIDIMNNISDVNKSDWLFYVYQYVLNMSFPHAVVIKLDQKLEHSAIIYLQILRTIFESERKNKDFNRFLDFQFLTDQEIRQLRNPNEYLRFKKAFDDNYIYELMRLSFEITHHNTIEHIAGVHFTAMHVGRQLKASGVPIDLGRISGAAAGHDVGKYGCVGEEQKRVAYYHYFYTELWFNKFNIPQIGHVALNHSTWDLELENLPLESLVLIYADFRVKNNNNGTASRMHIFSLKDSFNVILDKLDNVDEAKEKRYKRVYAKLKDFEDYMISKGVDINLISSELSKVTKKDNALLFGDEIVQNFKYMAISHNIDLMYKLSSDESLSILLEAARSENNWKNIRSYLNVFKEYTTYLTPKQKLLTLNFMYDLLMHREGDIRRQASEILGTTIAEFDDEYRKEIPADKQIAQPDMDSIRLWRKYLDMILNPDHKIIDQHRIWIGYSLKTVVGSLINKSNKKYYNAYIDVFLENLSLKETNRDKIFIILDALWRLPYPDMSRHQIEVIVDYISTFFDNDLETTVIALDTIDRITFLLGHDTTYFIKIVDFLSDLKDDEELAVCYLKFKISQHLKLKDSITTFYKNKLHDYSGDLSEIFLMNLKSAVPWIVKSTNVKYVEEFIHDISPISRLHTATHLCNLVKVSAVEYVRNQAGKALLSLAPLLSIDQRNDVAIELLRGLDIEGYEFSKYIPRYLGELMLYLHPKELDESIDDYEIYAKDRSSRTIPLILNTVAFIIEHYNKYPQRFPESKKIYDARLEKMIGILMAGLSNYDENIRQEAFYFIGKNIFNSEILTLEEKHYIFKKINKKLLTLLSEKDLTDVFFISNSASLNHIYRFISDYTFFIGEMKYIDKTKAAFFPGTFDPFSVGHKQIVKEIKSLGFEVYLALDEFSWSKKTQPRLYRRQIANLSIADELNVYLFPDDIPINIANNNDIATLKNLFSNKNIYLVVGSDVIINASAYNKRVTKSSIHSLNHIIFRRSSSISTEKEEAKTEEISSKIKGDVIQLQLPVHMEDISSSLIREYIDENRDISKLVDPMAQKFIYDYNLYLREPQYKTLIETKPLEIDIIENLTSQIRDEIGHHIFVHTDLYKNTGEDINDKKIKFLIIRETSTKGKILGFSAFHFIKLTELYREFKNTQVTEHIREVASGKILIIDGIYINQENTHSDLEQILITETLAHGLEEDLTYAVYHNILTNVDSKQIHEILDLQGFIKLPVDNQGHDVYGVDMRKTVSLMLNVKSFLKEPFNKNERIMSVANETRKRLQKSLTTLYPGSLVLTFNNAMLHHKLTKKICEANNVSNMPYDKRNLGELMCVPFGNFLQGKIVPNTVTKSLHTEKMFFPDLSGFKIGEYPNYPALIDQIKTIKSFDRSVILVDDLLHKGYRIKAIEPLFRKENIIIQKTIVGILSGRGKEIMDVKGRDVDGAYFIPNLRLWFNENLMYPFLGGDTILRSSSEKLSLIQSVNLILPYVAPAFIKETDSTAIFDLSLVCLENARDIMMAIEREYQKIYERTLTLGRLSEITISARYPDKGNELKYNFNVKPSVYIKNDIDELIRIKDIVKQRI
ncbi:MAG TPA: cytidyltransferase [Clostridiales bacterium]|nr:cytidyltransferase [Clostridiales bacterium]